MERRRVHHGLIVILAGLLWVNGLMPLGAAWAAGQAGIAWLAGQAQADGSYATSNDLATPVQATSETLRTFQALGQTGQMELSAASQFLAAESFGSTEYLARQIISASEAGATSAAQLAELLTRQNVDGGFGDRPGYRSSVLDTAFAVEALALAGVGQSEAAAWAIEFLLDQQRPDGGWADGINSSAVYVSALAMRALWYFRFGYEIETELDNAQTFLLDQRDGSTWSTTFETALSLLAILPRLNTLETLATALETLQASQFSNGSWDNDVYTTALALRALQFVGDGTSTGPIVPNPDLGTIAGIVVDGDSNQPLSGVVVTLAGAETQTLATGIDGVFRFAGLAAGEYALDLPLTDYNSLAATTTLSIGGVVDFGTLAMVKSANATTGTVRGVITNNLDQSLAGVIVTVNDLMTTTSNDGTYQINNVPAGAVVTTAELSGYAGASASGELQAGAVLLFSPRMMPADQADPDPDSAALYGVATDAATGSPLAGVTISVMGAATASAQTGANGDYRLTPLNAGALLIQVTLAGFDTVLTEVIVSEGEDIEFSPQLYAAGTAPPDGNGSTLTGIVMDSTTNEPLAGAAVALSSDNYSEQLVADIDGRFNISGITAAQVTLVASLPGYHDATFVLYLEPFSNRDMGQVRLRPETVAELLPDLSITATAHNTVTDPHSLAVGGAVDVLIGNYGTRTAAAPIEITAFYDNDRNDRYDVAIDTLLGKTALADDLSVAEEISAALDISGALPYRDASLSLWVDSAETHIERDEQNNIASTAALCRGAPPPLGAFEPVIKWQWNKHKALTIPIVAPLNDTNGDGIIDQADDPAIIFASHTGFVDNSIGTLRALDGKTGSELWSVTDPALQTEGSAHPAVGDIDGDNIPEIVMFRHQSLGGVVAINNDGTLKWISETKRKIGLNYGAITLTDLEGDGSVEILAHTEVLNSDGTTRWSKAPVWSQIVAIPVDLDLDGIQEVLIGGRAYRADGSLYWENGSALNGLNAIGNFDDDPNPEIAAVRGGPGIVLLDHDGARLWGTSLWGRRGGAPTIADMDGDGLPEIGVATRDYYNVLNHDGSIAWVQKISDPSGGTGSTVFDFDGDGLAEIVYGGTEILTVFDGATGDVLFSVKNGSKTATEYPVVADVDNDGHAELIVTSDYTPFGPPTYGVKVYEDRNDTWVATRRIWNQYAYHINNINDDLSIPAPVTPSWLSHNTYRLNALLDQDPLAQIDLSVGKLQVIDNGNAEPLSVRVRVGNGGLLALSSPASIAFYQGDPAAGGNLLGTVAIAQLAIDDYQDVQLGGVVLGNVDDLYALIDPDNLFPECNETNNLAAVQLASAAPLGQIAVSTDAASYQANSAITLSAELTNTGTLAASYAIALQIEDSAGKVVASFATETDADLDGRTALTLTETWNSGAALTGEYFVRGLLYDNVGRLLDEATATFLIIASAEPIAELRTVTDRPLYHTTDTVQIANLLTNLSDNVLLAGAVLQVQVAGPDGRTDYDETVPLGDLAPAGQRRIDTEYHLQGSLEGAYTVKTELFNSTGKSIASDHKYFDVAEDLRLALVGSVTVQEPLLEYGEMQFCTDTVANNGTLVVEDQVIRQLVIEITDAQILENEETTIDVAPAAAQTLLRTIDTAELSAGDYACVLEALIAGDWVTLDAAVFTVEAPQVQIDADLLLGNHGRILVLLDDAAGGQPLGPLRWDALPLNPEPRTFLETLLTELGWAYTVTTDADSFTAEFRSGGYVTYLLLSEHVKLAEQVQEELREAVYRGDGLIVAGDHDQRNGRLDEPLGIIYKGKSPHALNLILLDSVLAPANQTVLLVGDKVHKAALDGASEIAYFELEQSGKGKGAADSITAAAVNEYGAGRTVYAGFDLLAEAALGGEFSLFTDLIITALDYAHPSMRIPLTGAVFPVTVNLANAGIAASGQAVLQLPDAVTVVMAENAVLDDNALIWAFDLAVAEMLELTAWLRLPQIAGPVDIDMLLQIGTAPDLIDYDSLRLVLDVIQPAALADAQLTVSALAAADQRYGKAEQALTRAEQALAQGDNERAVRELLKTADELIKLATLEAAELRYAVSEAIRLIAQQL